MPLKDDVRPITELKSRTAQLIREVERERRPMVITQKGRARAVLLDVESWEMLRQSVAMLRIVAHAEADFEEGRISSTAEVFAAARESAGLKRAARDRKRR